MNLAKFVFLALLLLVLLTDLSLAVEKKAHKSKSSTKSSSRAAESDDAEDVLDEEEGEESVQNSTANNISSIPAVTTSASVKLKEEEDDTLHQPSQCSPFRSLPVLGNLARGVDIRSLDLLPTVLANRNGFGRPIFNFTCSAQLIESPLVKSELLAIPEQVESIEAKASPTVVSTHLYRNLSAFRTENSGAVRLPTNNTSSSNRVGRFVFSSSYHRLKARLRESKQLVGETHAAFQRYVVRLREPEKLTLSTRFAADLARLPSSAADPTQNWPLFEYFLDLYGTHYWAVASVGEVVSMRSTVRQEYLKKGLISEETLTTLLEAEFTRMVENRRLSGNFQRKAKAAKNGTRLLSSEEKVTFAKHVQTKFFWYGGGWRLGEPGLIFGGRLEPLDRLLVGQSGDPLLRSALQRAILIRGAQASLADLQDTISKGDEDEEYSDSSSSVILLEEEKKILQELEDYFLVITSEGSRYAYDEATLGKMIDKLASLIEKVEVRAAI